MSQGSDIENITADDGAQLFSKKLETTRAILVARQDNDVVMSTFGSLARICRTVLHAGTKVKSPPSIDSIDC